MSDATLNIHVTGLDGFKQLIERLQEIHQPEENEAEFFAWADDGGEHDRRFPDCSGDRFSCEGHAAPVTTCRECGHDYDGEYPVFRLWPCPTIKAVGELLGGGA